ncbi:expressed unknown protein [Seminavis robusta]|uniref:Uncharacterized protein n=1 Tax=Seminavis robusta TaxID=568900 RepID=A0A9N8DUJ2_9STRA|nr:expressed unknown protein [Seminavis robusta]|eukprot:Sro368_g127880.1 n/a (322) ;mRNA; f:2655-3620
MVSFRAPAPPSSSSDTHAANKNAPSQVSYQREPMSPSVGARPTCPHDTSPSRPTEKPKNTPPKQGSYSEAISYPVEYMRRPPKANAKVRFFGSVSVKEIPSYRSYDDESRKKMWSSHKEIELNAARNKREFAADKRDWKKCREEDEMLILEGKLVHPETYVWLQRHQQKQVVRRLRAAKKREDLARAGTIDSEAGVVSRVTGRILMKRPFKAALARKQRPATATIVPSEARSEHPLQDSSNLAVTGAKKERQRRAVLTPSAPPSNKGSDQGSRSKNVPVAKTRRNTKFVVRRRATLFRLPTRTARKELAARSGHGIVCQAS